MEWSLVILIPCILAIAKCDIEKDREKCGNQLLGVATCLPYVGGEGKAPPMDCCTGFKQVLKDSPECICLLIKDRDDPSLGLKINITIALTLPTQCNAPPKPSVTDCPAILHLPPNSPDAKVFEDFANSIANKTITTAPAPGPDKDNRAARTTSANEKSDGGKGKRWVGTQMVSGLLLAFIAPHILSINV